MTRLFAALPFAVAALVATAATPTAAQVAGTYAGTSQDGSGVTFTVGIDPNTNVLAITGASIGFSDTCSDGSTLTTGWGYSPLQDIVNRKVTNTTVDPYFVITFNLTFAKNGQSATGNITTFSPTLTPSGPKPKKALFCMAASQPMGVTLQTTAVANPPPAHTATMLGKVQNSAH
jgi:hypothetical protein